MHDLPPIPRVVISLDLEMRWGSHDKLAANGEAGSDHLLNVPTVVRSLLRFFCERQIRATWACVGATGCPDWADYFRRSPPPPAYRQAGLKVDPGYARLDPQGALHFIPAVLEEISRVPGQELGTHTFSHLYYAEEGIRAEDVKADLDAAAQLWIERFGFAPLSLVFPRNQANFLPTVRDCGIKIWRGTQQSWYHQGNDQEANRPWARALRILDALVPIARRAATLQADMTRSSMFVRTNLPTFFWRLHLRRIRREIFRLGAGQIYHLYWHPENLTTDTNRRLERISKEGRTQLTQLPRRLERYL